MAWVLACATKYLTIIDFNAYMSTSYYSLAPAKPGRSNFLVLIYPLSLIFKLNHGFAS
jgi:hypothetical protein